MTTRRHGWRGRLGFVLALALAWSMSGCQSGPPALPDLATALQRLAESGYRPQRAYETEALHDVWSRGELQLDVSFVAPSSPGEGPFPLLVYLPGLGQSSSSGALWRRAWAQAGYAVLAVQPMEWTRRVWASDLAREGDFQALAHKAFSASAAAERIEALSFAIGELKRRASAGAVPYRSADPSHVVLAGFDLGAQTVALVAGEASPGLEPKVSGAGVRAVIILSPYPRRDIGAQRTRFAALSLPALSITGSEDEDPLGVVNDPALRQQPWRSMPPGGKYLLVLAGGTHAMLAGDGLSDPYSGQSAGSGDSGDVAQKRRHGGRGRRAGGDTGDQMNLADSARAPMLLADESGTGEARGRRSDTRASGPRAYDLRQIAAVEDVGAAFLDAYVKDAARAREWLAEDAVHWLGASATLKVK